jgi:phosphoheptose isomerase
MDGKEYGKLYYLGMQILLSKFENIEIDAIGEITSQMSECLQKGNNVWMQAQAGHMGCIEFKEENKGNPRVLKSNLRIHGGDYEKMRPGDILVTNYVNENVRKARDNGVYVVGIPVCYIDNEFAPRDYIKPNVNNWLLKDVSNTILQSYIPHTQGIVDCPEIPEMKICPSSANVLCTLFWMIQAEVANKLKNRRAKPIDLSLKFIDIILERIQEAYRTQRQVILDTGALVAGMIGHGSKYHVTSDHLGVESEATNVAMGPMMTNAFKSSMKKGDIHLLASIEPDSQKIVDEAKKSHEMGMYTISIAPPNSPKIKEYSDVFIRNYSPEVGGLFTIDGFPEKVATAGGILNNWLMWIFTAQFIEEMVKRKWIPWFWMGYFRNGGTEYNQGVRPFFLEQGF